MPKLCCVSLAVLLPVISVIGQSVPMATNTLSAAASAINSIGTDLLHETSHADANALLSPYSIETALAMTYAGADGFTREEMARVLHLRGDAAQIAREFAALQAAIDGVVQRSLAASVSMKQYGVTNDPMTLATANRLFGQQGYDFRPPFLDLLKTEFHAPFQAMDFRKNSAAATKTINDWVEEQTRQRIRNLIPAGALNDRTRLVLVNAIYLKAPWAEPFPGRATKPLPFHAGDGAAVNVPTMTIRESLGYQKFDGFTALTIPYKGGEIQFLILLPDATNGLAALESKAPQLAACANLPSREVNLFLPKFKIEPPTLALGDALQKLGMTSAFDKPRGSANFDRMAPRRPNDYLCISDVFHKTFMSVDEKGTEAAAATAVAMVAASAMQRPSAPVEVHVDHPFIFAIQHRASGACLFLGHLANPK